VVPVKRCISALGVTSALMLVGCTTYTSVHKANDGTVYISGVTEPLIGFKSPWIKRCRERRGTLECESLKVVDGDASDDAPEPAKPKASEEAKPAKKR
jgi:hypothetical protein